jgi:hypothetical protein
MAIFLNSFTPLAVNKFGRAAAAKYSLPFYIDGSCRREPDFENLKPAITQLCRPTKLVTRLSKGDLVIYITKLGRYGTNQSHWKLISILEVIDIVPDHNAALAFYTNNRIPVSQNIICSSTIPFAFDMTHRLFCGFGTAGLSGPQIISKWDTSYNNRAKKYPEVAITQVWNNISVLINPPIINHQMMKSIFGRIPGTQNPPKLSDDEWQKFKTIMNL